MDLTERTLDSQVIFEGKIVRLRRDIVEVPGGAHAVREVVDHPGGVGIIPVDDKGNVMMVRQFRYPIGRVALEIPAGKLEPNEDPRLTAERELSEEVGVTAGKLTYLGHAYASPGFSGEHIHLYLAENLTFGESHPEEDEFLQPERIPLDELVEMALDGRLHDGKSVIGVLRAAAAIKRGE